jgi:hypothetical protein
MTNKAPFCAFLWLTLSVLSRQIRSLPAYQVGLWSLPAYQLGPRNLLNLLLIKGLRLRRITYEKIKLFLQNEPKFRKSQVNVTDLLKRNYEQMDTWSSGKTKPIQSQLKPIKANSKPIKANKMPKQTQFCRGVASGEAGSNPIYRGVASGEAGTNPTCRGVASGEAGSNPICRGPGSTFLDRNQITLYHRPKISLEILL